MKAYYIKLLDLVKKLQKTCNETNNQAAKDSQFNYLIGYVEGLAELASDNSVQDY